MDDRFDRFRIVGELRRSRFAGNENLDYYLILIAAADNRIRIHNPEFRVDGQDAMVRGTCG